MTHLSDDIGQPAKLILLTGMHRSGTSLLGRVLQGLGVPLPGELIAADHFNPTGYFERRDVTAVHEQLLINLDRWWPTAEGCQPLPEGWMDMPLAREASEELRAILQAELRVQHRPWAIKDPRICRLLPLWRSVAGSLGIQLHVIYSLRDPSEVCTSLLNRDGPLVGMDLDRAETLWCLHYSELFRDSINLPCHGVDYELWFSQPQQQLQRIARVLQVSLGNTARSAGLASIEPALRRSRDVHLPRPVNPLIAAHYQDLRSRLIANYSSKP